MKRRNNNWIYIVFVLTFILSIVFGLVSNTIINNLDVFFAIVVLIVIILIGITFDIIGVAIQSCDISPFTAKASRKYRGAKEAILLLKNTDKISNICNDVIGDICGIISGALGAVLSIKLGMLFEIDVAFLGLIIGAVIASFTVFGKAIGKGYAVRNNVKIIYKVGSIIHFIFRKEKKMF